MTFRTDNTWPESPTSLALGYGHVHIWCLDLSNRGTKLESFSSFLCTEELDRASQFRFEKDRNSFVATRGLLRTLLGSYLKLEPRDITFGFGPHGKPMLPGDHNVKFNVSHTDKISLLAFTKETEIGVDLERLDRKIEVEEIAKRFFAPAEIRRLLALPSERRPIGFFNCWTRKEAIIKALGTGLAMPLDKYEVSLSSKSEKVKLIETHGGQEDVQEWSLFSLAPKPGYVGAVALKGPVEDLKCWSWR